MATILKTVAVINLKKEELEGLKKLVKGAKDVYGAVYKDEKHSELIYYLWFENGPAEAKKLLEKSNLHRLAKYLDYAQIWIVVDGN